MRKYLLSAVMLAASVTMGAQGFKINQQGYFELGNANVMVFSDGYPEGKAGGVTIVMGDERKAASGDVRFEQSQGQWQPLPKVRSVEVDTLGNTIMASLSYPDTSRHARGFNPMFYPDFAFDYTVTVKAQKDYVTVDVELSKPVPERFAGKLGFNMELEVSTLLGKPWIMDQCTGVFPYQPMGPTVVRPSNLSHIGDFSTSEHIHHDFMFGDGKSFNPMVADDLVGAAMATGHRFTLNPQDQLHRITFESSDELKLYDGRMNHNNGWFVLRTEFAAGQTHTSWTIRPTIDNDWRHTPVVQTSQVGYHPDEKKMAVIELDKRDNRHETATLYRIDAEGKKAVKTAQPHDWGMFMRYHYLQFDFTDITTEGIYQIDYAGQQSSPFRIDRNIWAYGVWQPEIEYFLPIQMCHVRVMDKYRVWHDYCHTDDALMAPTNINHIDGYVQGSSTLCKYQPEEMVPGLAIGGWHDAGDFDLRIESQSTEAYQLAMEVENLDANWDETTIDFANSIVEIHQPDGKNDYLQQVENGALTVVAGWKALGRLYRGIICPTVRQYVMLGEPSQMTDGQKGNADDRRVFTEDNPGRELSVAANMAGVARVLKGYNDTLATQCLEIAETLWHHTTASNDMLKASRIQAAVELYLTTDKKEYCDFVLSERDFICKNIMNTGWFIGRFEKKVADKRFTKAIMNALPQLADMFEKLKQGSPYGLSHHMRGGFDSGSWAPQHTGMRYCFLNQAYPDLFPSDYIVNCVQLILGLHPGQNRSSFVGGVGAETMRQNYGFTRGDWGYIPGGVAPGTNIIHPDMPELLRFPFLWQQGEFCVDGANTAFTYMVKHLEKMHK